MAAMTRVGEIARGAKPLRDIFFVQPMAAVVAPPNLSAHKPARNCASGDDDRPYMPSPCRRGAFAQSKGEADGRHAWDFNPPPTTKVTNNRFYDHVFNPYRRKIHRGLTGHSGQ